MKASKFTDAQKAFMIKQNEGGASVAEVCRKGWVSQATFSKGKKNFGVLMPSKMKSCAN